MIAASSARTVVGVFNAAMRTIMEASREAFVTGAYRFGSNILSSKICDRHLSGDAFIAGERL